LADIPHMPTKQELQQIRLKFRHEISQFPEIIEGEPRTWWRQTARMVIGFRQGAGDYHNPKMREYLEKYADISKMMLRQASTIPIDSEEQIITQTEHMIMNLSMEMAKRFEPKEIQMETHFIPLAEIVKHQPDRFKTDERTINGVRCVILSVKHPTKNEWQEIPLPKNQKIWHKGGPARAVLDIVAHSPISMQEAEFPWNDFDVVLAEIKKAVEAAIAIGVDPDGIEYMGENNLNFERFCLGRDTQQNQVCLGAEGLYYSQAALMSAITGHVNIVGEYMANKAIYGIDRMTIQKISMAKQRGLMRLLKAVAEGKALSFDHLPINANFDMGIYTLFLAKRWSKKEGFPEHMQKMYFLLKQMGQVRHGENDIFQVLDRAMKVNPFFDFDREVRTPIEVVRWKSRKFPKQLDRELAWLFNFPSSLKIRRRAGDNVSKKVSLDGFVPDKTQVNIDEKWDIFLGQARKITGKYYEKERSPYEKIFGIGYEDTEDLGIGFDDLIFLDDE
jgi:hypothetical protein